MNEKERIERMYQSALAAMHHLGGCCATMCPDCVDKKKYAESVRMLNEVRKDLLKDIN